VIKCLLQRSGGSGKQAQPQALYHAVAAGFFDEEGKAVAKSYNNLKAIPVGASTFRLTFGISNPKTPSEGYINPLKHGNSMYIIKGTVFGRVRGTIHVVSFQDNGILVKPVSLQGDSRLSFMVEISQYAWS
jgi:hypothetical protein